MKRAPVLKRWKTFQEDRQLVLKSIRDNQSSLAEHHAAARLLFREPAFLVMMSVIPLSVWSGFTPMPFRDQSVTVNVAVMWGAAFLYAGAIYAWLGSWYSWGVARNIPAVWMQCAFYAVAHAVFHLGFGPLFFDVDVWRPLTRFARVLPVGIIFTATIAIYHTARYRGMLGQNPELVPVLWPVSAKFVKQTTLFSATRYGRLRWMIAENKGSLLVTETGEHFVRRSLAEMSALLDPNLGIKCHRSLWVAFSEIEDVQYFNGNPQITLIDGRVFPISRATVPKIRAQISLRLPKSEMTDKPESDTDNPL